MRDTDSTSSFSVLEGFRAVFGGVLMGLANLVPGISGGTMLLAAGVYPQFIRGIAEVSTFRFRWRTLLLLAFVVGSAFLAIALGARFLKTLVIEQRWVMFSLFIGLTLGGVPIIWRLIRPTHPKRIAIALIAALTVGLMMVLLIRDTTGTAFLPAGWGRAVTIVLAGTALLALPMVWMKLPSSDRDLIVPAVAGITAMVVLAIVQANGAGDAAGSSANGQTVMLFIAGLAAGSAMILPGVSGGYLLLILGQYLAILAGIDEMKNAVSARDVAAMADPARILIPFGIGVGVGVIGVSNLVRVLMDRFEKATLGVLLGLLLGAIFGLWPFEAHVRPAIGDVIKGVKMLSTDMIDALDAEDWPTRGFTPSAGQILGSIGCIVIGLIVSVGIDHLGGRGGGDRDANS
ncbi:MAG: DUF368 domain-containing protein [Planctomycetota bacterium]